MRVSWLLVVLIALSSVVYAQPSEPDSSAVPEAPKPWAVGISESEQARALELYELGNAEFKESLFAAALLKYREALTHWDHPAIRFNMAVCLINLDQPLEAKDNLERGLAFGEGPLGPDAYAQGLTYRKLLDRQLTQVKIACNEPGAEVTLDGKHLFTGPGEVVRHLLPGDHQVVATKPGFLTASETLVLAPGKLTNYDVRLVAFKAAPTMVRRWTSWKPWALTAGGAALVGFGTIALAIAASNFDDYDANVRARCPTGCDAMMAAEIAGLRDAKDRAEIQQVIGVSLLSLGGAVAVAGVVGLVLNQPRAMVENRVTPAITPTRGGGTFTVRWSF